jgi:hypothetical protein
MANQQQQTRHFFAPVHAGHAFWDHDTESVLVIDSVNKKYIDSEDACVYGLMPDVDGWVYFADCRDATPDEAKPILNEMQTARDAAARGQRIDEIEQHVRDYGRFPEGRPAPEGEVLLDTSDPYGSGRKFVITNDSIWLLLNHHADGDDWSANNIDGRALGYAVPRNEALIRELRELDAGRWVKRTAAAAETTERKPETANYARQAAAATEDGGGAQERRREKDDPGFDV